MAKDIGIKVHEEVLGTSREIRVGQISETLPQNGEYELTYCRWFEKKDKRLSKHETVNAENLEPKISLLMSMGYEDFMIANQDHYGRTLQLIGEELNSQKPIF
ncbi:MAG: hypothetical protein AABW50_05515 [Nanoarchaeota archaeon]